MNQFKIATFMLNNGSATFNEVTRINVGKCAHLLDFGMMDVPTDNPIKALVIQGVDDTLLVIRDELDGIFDLELDERGQ